MLGERFPNRLRASVLAIAASAQWLANWAISGGNAHLGKVVAARR